MFLLIICHEKFRTVTLAVCSSGCTSRRNVSVHMICFNKSLLTIHGHHHPKADVGRLYVPRKQGGRGLIQLEAAHAVEITKLVEYVDRKEGLLIQVVRTHQHNTDSAVLQTARCLKTEVQREKQEK